MHPCAAARHHPERYRSGGTAWNRIFRRCVVVSHPSRFVSPLCDFEIRFWGFLGGLFLVALWSFCGFSELCVSTLVLRMIDY